MMKSSRLITSVLEEDIYENESTKFLNDQYYYEQNSVLLETKKLNGRQYKLVKSSLLGIDRLFCDENKFLPIEIVQGEIEDCWIVSSVCAIVERQHHLLKNAILQNDINKFGRYTVRLCIAGRWRFVELDDQLPCHNVSRHKPENDNALQDELCYNITDLTTTTQLAFAKSNQHLYMPLIEKAFAIALGSNRYHNLATGFSYEAFATLTGMPVSKMVFNKQKSLEQQWQSLIGVNSLHLPVTASCGNGALSKLDKQFFYSAKLRPKHCYVLLDIDKRSKNVQLYNPWGFFQPDNGCDNNSNGIFWIEFAKFVKYFDSIDICKWKPNLQELRFYDLKKFDVIYLRVNEKKQLHLALFQEMRNTRTPSKDLCLIVLDSFYNLVKSTENRRFDSLVNLEIELDPGDYLLVPLSFHHWNNSECALNISIHSTMTISGNVIEESGEIVRIAIAELLNNFGKRQELCNGITLFILSTGWCGLFVSVENRLKEHFVHLKCDSSASQNVISTRESLVVADTIAPGHEQILFILTHCSPLAAMSISHNVYYRVSCFETLPQDVCFNFWIDTNSQQDKQQQKQFISHYPPLDTQLNGIGLALHTPSFIREPIDQLAH